MNDADAIVFFRSGELVLALPCAETREIRRHSTGLVPLPLSPAGIAGVLNLRGAIVTVFSLDFLLKQNPGRQAQILIVRSDDEDVGLLIDEVLDIAAAAPPEALPAHLPESLKRHLDGILRTPDGQLACLLRCSSLLETAR